MFVPLLSLDEHRIMQNRNFCLCCIKHNSDEDNTTETFAMRELVLAGDHKKLDRSRSQSQSTKNQNNNNSNNTNNTNSATTNTNGEDAENDSTSGNTKGLHHILGYFSVTSFVTRCIIPLQQRKAFRLSIIAIFILFNILSIVSFQWLDSTSDTTKFVSDDSYVISWNEEVIDGYGEISSSETSIILEHIDFSNKTIRNRVETLIASLESYNTSNGYSLGNVETWYWDFLAWVNDSLHASNDTNTLTIDDLTRAQFYQHLQEFANDTANETAYAQWASILLYGYEDEEETVIIEVEATKWFIWTNKAAKLGDIWPLKLELDDIMQEDLQTKDGFFTDDFFPWAYLESVIISFTVANMGFALIGVLAVMILLVDLKMSIFIALVVVMIDVGMYM